MKKFSHILLIIFVILIVLVIIGLVIYYSTRDNFVSIPIPRLSIPTIGPKETKLNYSQKDLDNVVKLTQNLTQTKVKIPERRGTLKSKNSSYDYAPELLTIQCPGGICSGLGESFDLREINLADPKQLLNGKPIFKNLNLLNPDNSHNKCFEYNF